MPYTVASLITHATIVCDRRKPCFLNSIIAFTIAPIHWIWKRMSYDGMVKATGRHHNRGTKPGTLTPDAVHSRHD
jgi:hypothetical protein